MAELSLTGETDLAAAARQCLGSFPGKDADAAVVGMLTHKDAKVRCVAVELIGRRPKALGIVRAAAADNDSQVRDTANPCVCDWPTADALPLVANLIKAAQNPTIKILAIRGFVRLIPQQDAPNPEEARLAQGRDGPGEPKRGEGACARRPGQCPHGRRSRVVTSQMDNSALREDACVAAVVIAEKLASSKGGEVAEAMRRVAKLTSNKVLVDRANAIVREASRSRQ